MIWWEATSLDDREKIYEFLYAVNPLVAEQTDALIEAKVELLQDQPLLGVQREGMRGRLLIIAEISMLVLYCVDSRESTDIRVLRVIHQKQQFPPA